MPNRAPMLSVPHKMSDFEASTTLPRLDEPWCPVSDYQARLTKVREAIEARGLAGLVLFQPESVTWLTGFYTRGYGSFQCVLVPSRGEPVTCCRDMETYYRERTSVFPEHVYWTDTDNPVDVAAAMIRKGTGRQARLGLEMSAWPLTTTRFNALVSALPDVEFLDSSDLIQVLRRYKSPSEVRLMRHAASAAEAGMKAAANVISAGRSEREVAADISAALIRAGSDMPGPGVLSSGERANHLHGSYVDRVLEEDDLVQFEVLACVRHYHARFMRPIKVGTASQTEMDVAARLIEIQDLAMAEIGPGVPATIPDAVYRKGVLDAGLAETYTNKTFYGLGLLLPPVSGEPPEASPAADWSFEPGMTFHTYVLARGFGVSETIHVTDDGYERLTHFPRKLIVGGGRD